MTIRAKSRKSTKMKLNNFKKALQSGKCKSSPNPFMKPLQASISVTSLLLTLLVYPKAASKILSNKKDKDEDKGVSRAKIFLEQSLTA